MIGAEIHAMAREIWPFNRSLTGDGVRQTLEVISQHLTNFEVNTVKSGTRVFDWEIPNEWNVKAAYIITPKGEKICDFQKNNLHLLGYSIPFSGKLTLDELRNYLFTRPDLPKAIPYVTSYYEERWGFCLSHEQYEQLEDGLYDVVIETSLKPGELTYGELLIKGQKQEEIFLSTYICHPSMANNEISGICVTTFLSRWLQTIEKRKYTYRIIFIPETIGSVYYLSKNMQEMKDKIVAGFNISCIGDERSYSYLPSRAGNTLSDTVAQHILKWICPDFIQYTWLDRGSDERQYCAPGVDLPIASIHRSKFATYDEYHTSLDNLETVVTPQGLNGGYWALRRAIEALENNGCYKTPVFCEPQMGRRGLYQKDNPNVLTKNSKLTMDFLSYCDGHLNLLQIADVLGVPIWDLYDIKRILLKNELIYEL